MISAVKNWERAFTLPSLMGVSHAFQQTISIFHLHLKFCLLPILITFHDFSLPLLRLLGPTGLSGRSGHGYGSDYQDLGSPHSCKTLKVTSKHSSFQGEYQLSEVVMNGKPSWKWKEKHKGGFHLHLSMFTFWGRP